MSNTAPSRANPVVVFPLGRWFGSSQNIQKHVVSVALFTVGGDYKCYAQGKTCHHCNKRCHLKPMCHDLVKKLEVSPAQSFSKGSGRPEIVSNQENKISKSNVKSKVINDKNNSACEVHVLLANDVFTGLHSKCQSGQMLVCSCTCNLKTVSDASCDIENIEANFETVKNVDCQHKNVFVFKCSCAGVPQIADSATAQNVRDSVAVSLVGDSATAAQQCESDSVVVAHVDSSAVATHVFDRGATSLMGDIATAPHINQTVCDIVG